MSQCEIVRPSILPNPYFFGDAIRFGIDECDQLFIHAAKVGASDINIQSGRPIFLEINGEHWPVTKKSLDKHETANIINGIYGQNGSAMMRQGVDIDPAYELRPSKTERYRFRINASSCYAGFEDGMQITARIISSKPPLLSDIKIDQGITDNFYPENGLIVISGATGSGKSTTLAAHIRHAYEDENRSFKLITYESPIEYVYDELKSDRSIISQHEIPRHIKSWSGAVRNAMRRAPDYILVGECRDAETIDAALEASNTGHTLYTTLHANSVPEVFYRMVNMFSPNERNTKMYEILSSARMIVTQRLVRSQSGGRCGLREYLVFDDETRETLRRCETLREMTLSISEMVRDRKQTMYDNALRALEAGLISEQMAESFRYRGELYAKV